MSHEPRDDARFDIGVFKGLRGCLNGLKAEFETHAKQDTQHSTLFSSLAENVRHAARLCDEAQGSESLVRQMIDQDLAKVQKTLDSVAEKNPENEQFRDFSAKVGTLRLLNQ